MNVSQIAREAIESKNPHRYHSALLTLAPENELARLSVEDFLTVGNKRDDNEPFTSAMVTCGAHILQSIADGKSMINAGKSICENGTGVARPEVCTRILQHVAAHQPGGPAMMATLALNWNEVLGDQKVVKHFAFREVFRFLDDGMTPRVAALAYVGSKALRTLEIQLPQYAPNDVSAQRACGAMARATYQTIADHPQASFSEKTWARMAGAALGPESSGQEASHLSEWLEQRVDADKESIVLGFDTVARNLQPEQRAQVAVAALGALKELGAEKSPEARPLWKEAAGILGHGPMEESAGVRLAKDHVVIGGTWLKTRN
jgi:hypothetical protein